MTRDPSSQGVPSLLKDVARARRGGSPAPCWPEVTTVTRIVVEGPPEAPLSCAAAFDDERKMPLELLDIDAEPARIAMAVLDGFTRGAVVFPCGPVWAVIAAPSRAGADALDRAKARRPDKRYGVLVADRTGLADLPLRGAVHPALRAGLAAPSSVILRIPVAPPHVQTPALCDGTLQLAPIDGALRAPLAAVQTALASQVEPGIFGASDFAAPLGSSCNVSGDPRGAIVDEEEALGFARARECALFLRGPLAPAVRGSFAIIGLETDGWRLCRAGAGLAEFAAQVTAPRLDDAPAHSAT